MHDMVVLLHLLYSTNWEALCEGCFVVGDKTRVQLNAKMLQAVNRYLPPRGFHCYPKSKTWISSAGCISKE